MGAPGLAVTVTMITEVDRIFEDKMGVGTWLDSETAASFDDAAATWLLRTDDLAVGETTEDTIVEGLGTTTALALVAAATLLAAATEETSGVATALALGSITSLLAATEEASDVATTGVADEEDDALDAEATLLTAVALLPP